MQLIVEGTNGISSQEHKAQESCSSHKLLHRKLVLYADLKRARMQQDMRVEHTNTTAMKLAHRRAEAQLLQARQVKHSQSYHGSLCSHAMCENGTLLMKRTSVFAWRRSQNQMQAQHILVL
jgi:ribosomal protein L35AE/L33A